MIQTREQKLKLAQDIPKRVIKLLQDRSTVLKEKTLSGIEECAPKLKDSICSLNDNVQEQNKTLSFSLENTLNALKEQLTNG